MNKRRIRVGVIALALAGLLATVVYAANLKPGTKAPDFTLPTLNGKTFTMSDCFNKAARKVVILDLWAAYCPPCRDEIPYLVDMDKKYRKKGLKIVGVALDKDKRKVEKFVKDKKMKYTVPLDPNATKVGSPYKLARIPVTYVIDKKGVIRFVHAGFPRNKAQQRKQAAKIEGEVKKLLAEK